MIEKAGIFTFLGILVFCANVTKVVAAESVPQTSASSDSPSAASSQTHPKESKKVSLNKPSSQKQTQKAKWKAPWRGSYFLLRNGITARSFDKDADLTYNPYYAIALAAAPKWWLGDVFNVSGKLSLVQEVTEADDTTKDRETQLSDFVLALAWTQFATIPHAKIDLSAKLGLIFPSSKASQAATMNLAVRPEFSLSHTFNALQGVKLFYKLAFTKYFHDYTTRGLESPLIPGCSFNTSNCNAYLNTGVRNVNFAFLNQFGMSIGFTKKFSVAGSVGLVHNFLYEIENDGFADQAQSVNVDGTLGDSEANVRYSMLYNLEASYLPTKRLAIAFGADTANSQLRKDGAYEQPFFNRYTVLYLDLRFVFAGPQKSKPHSSRSK